MFNFLANLLFKITLTQVHKISVAPDEKLIMVFRTGSLDEASLVNLRKVMTENLPELAERLILLVSEDDIDIKTYQIKSTRSPNEYN